jgi:hypothetical protein
MKKQISTLSLMLLALFGAAPLLLSGCGDDAVEEPALYTPTQIRRLLTANSSKVWTQSTEYYLEDSCRTGYRLLFSENAKKEAGKPFLAYFYRDTTLCEAVADSIWTRQVVVPKLPQFATSDSLAFFQVEGEDSIYSYSTIKLLTSQRLLLEYTTPEGNQQEAEYRALMEE